MIPPESKSFGTSLEPRARRKRRELVVAVFVGLIFAALVAYGFYEYSLKHAAAN